ncbi:M2 family metallopeptidase [Hymenobacter humi]|uniref:M2 family metallopeptidase n=1 Tax=Hymenobacter humi TaxID=1411620 RepID=A0ABW2UB88_9BACT
MKQVPDYLPAHWLPNRWGQDWGSMVDVKGLNLDATLAKKGAEWQVKQGERFYQSLGFPALPASFYEKSSLYPLPKDAGYKKNNHASAWHMDLNQDLRSLMSVEPNTEWYETAHHEPGPHFLLPNLLQPRRAAAAPPGCQPRLPRSHWLNDGPGREAKALLGRPGFD